MNLRKGIRLLLISAFAVGSLFVLSQDQDPERKAEWETSKHNNVNTTLVQATVEVRQATAATAPDAIAIRVLEPGCLN